MEESDFAYKYRNWNQEEEVDDDMDSEIPF